MQRGRQHDQERGRGGQPVHAVEPCEALREEDPDDQRRRPADERDPGDDRRAALVELVAEVARIGELERGAGAEPDRQRADRGQPARAQLHRRRGRSANGTKPAARRACEIETASAKRVKSSGRSISASTSRNPPSTNAAQRRLAARTASGTESSAATASAAAPAEHLRREPVAPVREDVELALVVHERTVHLVRRRVDRRGLARDRPQPERDRTRRDDDGGEAQQPLGDLGPGEQRAGGDEADERDQDEERVGRVDERERPGRDRRASRARPATARRRKRRRARSRPARAAAGSPSRAAPAPCTSRRSRRRARTSRPSGEHRQPAPGRAEDLLARLPRDEERDRHEHARLVLNDRRRVDPGEPGDEREEAVPERERVPGVQPAVTELVDACAARAPRGRRASERGRGGRGRPHRSGAASGTRARSRSPTPAATTASGTGDRPPACPDRITAATPAPHRDRGEQDQRPRQRGVDEEHHRGRDEQRAEAPRQGSREARHAQRGRDQEAGHEQTGRRRGESQAEPPAGLRERAARAPAPAARAATGTPRAPASYLPLRRRPSRHLRSLGGLRQAYGLTLRRRPSRHLRSLGGLRQAYGLRERAASRYIRPRSPGKITPRTVSADRSSRADARRLRDP